MRFILIISILCSSVNSQISYVDYANDGNSYFRNSPGGTDISLSNNVGYSRTYNGGSAAVNSIIISGDSGPQRPHNDVNSVRIYGQNGRNSNGPLNIALRNNYGVAEDIPNGSFAASFPNANQYPQNNFNANRRPAYYPVNQQNTAPSALRPSFQYPGVKNSLNSPNSNFKGITTQYGGLSNPLAFQFGR